MIVIMMAKISIFPVSAVVDLCTGLAEGTASMLVHILCMIMVDVLKDRAGLRLIKQQQLLHILDVCRSLNYEILGS